MEFVVLPDCPAGGPCAARLRADRRIDYPSGRPWIVGDWADDEAVVVTAGARRMVLFGPTGLDERAAADRLGRLRSPGDADPLAAHLAGSFHLLVNVDGEVRVQGSVAGVRQVYSATVDGVTVAASGVAPLRRLTGAPLDEGVLAARLLAPGGAPWPLALRPVRRGITPLRTGHWLRVGADGSSRQVRWWRLPEATLSLAEGAGAVRAALSDALAARVRPGRRVSADLSGGMDSTTLCFLADAAGADLVTYHVAPLDSANEDTVWARRAAQLLPRARHHTLTADRTENLFDIGYTADHPGTAPEGPSTWASGLTHIRDLARRARGEGATLHLSGFGGDELFGRMPTSAWSLARARPVSGLRLVNRYRLANRWSWTATVRALADRSAFARNLSDVAARIDAPPPPLDTPDFGWVFAPRMPAWATPDAVARVRGLLTAAAAEQGEPLDADRARHQALASLVFEGATIRQVNAALAGTGIVWDAPFLDDRVIEAALATRVEDRLASGRFKPLLTDAVRGAVPDGVLDRRDKGEFSAEAFRGLARNRARILELAEDSRLAALGLIDPARFRAAVLNPGPMSHHLQPIDTTVACESWLRTQLDPVQDTGVQETGVRR